MIVPPVVRYMLICDDVEVESTSPLRLNIEGLLTSIYVRDIPPFPARVRRLTVLLTLTEGRGRGIGQIVCMRNPTSEYSRRPAVIYNLGVTRLQSPPWYSVWTIARFASRGYICSSFGTMISS